MLYQIQDAGERQRLKCIRRGGLHPGSSGWINKLDCYHAVSIPA
nr:MAG TPA: aragonite protein [Caudoviricetes sp.]